MTDNTFPFGNQYQIFFWEWKVCQSIVPSLPEAEVRPTNHVIDIPQKSAYAFGIELNSGLSLYLFFWSEMYNYR